MKKRTGVFVCHCGNNIAGYVDVRKLAEDIGKDNGVFVAEDHLYMCSEPGQSAVINSIKKNKLDSAVISCCSPNLHEKTFRDAAREAGMNQFQCEIANIREQCAWVHNDKDEATAKATTISRNAVRRATGNRSLDTIGVPVTRRAMVIGGGIAGVQAALDLAQSGMEVVLVEKEPTLGGNMLKLSETFPTLDCSQCILSPKMVEVSKHPNITVITSAEVTEVTGFVGNFKATIRQKALYVDPETCKICDDCTAVCPVVVPNEFNEGLTGRRAIHIPFAQSIPASYYLDIDNCLGLNPIACGKCADACDAGAIDYDRKETVFEEDIGAIIVATGFDLYGKENFGEFGQGKSPNVLDGLQFERLLSASGATGGKILRPSDHKIPKEIVFIQCAGSRDPEQHCAYCSKICCMYTAKHAMLYKHLVPDGQAYIFYIDIRTGGKGYEEFYHRAMEEDDAIYLRGRVSRVFEKGDKLTVMGTDTLSGQNVEINADMVVLALAMQPSKGTETIAKTLKIARDKDGFLTEAHPKLRPVESVTAGIFLAGTAQGPKDIPETVSQASAAAAKVIILLSKDELAHAPTIAEINKALCTGCDMCVQACPYTAISLADGKAQVNDVLCVGCGVCSATCLRNAVNVKNMAPHQIHDMISSTLGW